MADRGGPLHRLEPRDGHSRKHGVSGHVDVLATAGLTIVALMVVTWVVSVMRLDARIADIVWGAGLALVTVVSALVGDGDKDRSLLLVMLVAIWGLRLTGHLWWRTHGADEELRYRVMHRRGADRFGASRLITGLGRQGVLMWMVALPVQLAMTPLEPRGVGVLAIVGVGIWGVGFFVQMVADAQLARFRSTPDNADQVMDRGLWHYTRHPNYFGDCCVWWGIFLVAAETVDARYGLVGPILVSASAFFPLPPRIGCGRH